MWPLLFSFLFALIVGIVFKWHQTKTYWAARGVPHDKPTFFLGSLGFLKTENPVTWLRRQYEKFSPSPYFGMWLVWRPALIITSPELARNILVKDSEFFRDRYVKCGKHDPIGSLNIFTLHDPMWSSIRRQMTPVFTSSKLRLLHPMRQMKTKLLIERIKKENINNNTIDMRELYTSFTTDIIGTAFFGMESSSVETNDSVLRQITRDFMTYTFWRGLGFKCIFFVPQLVPLLRFRFFPKETTNTLTKVFKEVVAQRKLSNIENKDLLDTLLKIKTDSQLEGGDMTEDIILAQAAIFVQGGFDTSAVAMTYCVYELAYNPHVQAKLYEEIVAAKEKLGTDQFDQPTLAEMSYLNCVLKETMRKHTAMGWLDRIASQDYKVDDNLTISEGTPVYVCSSGFHYDPDFFPEPEKFDPDRFGPENERNVKPFTFLPFGEGPRNCIGLRFAYEVMRIAIAALVLNFQLKPLPGFPTPNEVGIEKRGVFLSPDRMLSVQFVERK